MTKQPNKELSPEELAKAAGGFEASQVRGKDEISGADMSRVTGGAIPQAQHELKDPADADERRTRNREQDAGGPQVSR